jgi:ElaB protein
MGKPNSLSEAIRKLEDVTSSPGKSIKEGLEKDLDSVMKAIEGIKPHLDEIKGKLGDEAREAKRKTEDVIKENPWYALGIVGLIAFFVGWLLGNSRR